jgi:hypothetical protein
MTRKGGETETDLRRRRSGGVRGRRRRSGLGGELVSTAELGERADGLGLLAGVTNVVGAIELEGLASEDTNETTVRGDDADPLQRRVHPLLHRQASTADAAAGAALRVTVCRCAGSVLPNVALRQERAPSGFRVWGWGFVHELSNSSSILNGREY